MKKSKLIMPLTGIAMIGATVTPMLTLTSCGEKIKAISQDLLNLSGDGKTLYGLKDEANISGCNALVIPDSVTTIVPWAFITSKTGHTTIPGIKKLILNEKCNNFGSFCFAFAEFNKIDFTKCSSDAAWFKDGEFGYYSFYGFTEPNGTLVFNGEWKEYKKHQIKTALYQAGLYSQGWYDYTLVSTKAELREAATIGGNIKITADIELGEGEGDLEGEIAFKKNCLVDLNGHTIKATNPIWFETKKQWSMFAIWGDVNVVIDDSSPAKTGAIKAPELTDEQLANGYSTYVFQVRTQTPGRESPSLEIVDGKYYGNSSVIYNWNAQVYIDGGEFHIYKNKLLYDAQEQYDKQKTKDAQAAFNYASKFVINCRDETYQSGVADFYVSGGRFYDWKLNFQGVDCENYFDPSDAKCEAPREGETKVSFVDELLYEVVKHQAAAVGEENYCEVKSLL